MGDVKGNDLLEFEEVLKEEKEHIEEKLRKRKEGERPKEPFSLAFSGGGIRAAAFQAGVLWRLAEEGRLQDVEYFTAVSGGGYITSAFATHVLAAEKENPPKGDLKAWYLEVVAKTLCRMQNNAGDFVRDFVKQPKAPTDGSGFLPRALDLPILLLMLVFTILVHPFFFVSAVVMPFTLAIELFFGAAMKATFCAPEDWMKLSELSPFWSLVAAFKLSFLATFGTFVLTRLIPKCKRVQTKRGDKTVNRRALVGHALSGMFLRLTLALGMLICFLGAATAIPIMQLSGDIGNLPSPKDQMCANPVVDTSCGNILGGTPWYEHLSVNVSSTPKEDIKFLKMTPQFSVASIFAYVFLGLLVCGVCLMPIIGASLAKLVIWVGPLFLIMLVMVFVQNRVFGPITRTHVSWTGTQTVFDQKESDAFMGRLLVIILVVLPFYEEIRAVLHVYYKRCLQRNYFSKGQDIAFSKFEKESIYCPFVILTGTSSDYQPPDDLSDSISELSFSALHCGSRETNYVKMPPWRTLGKCTALTGAGCLDAISLSMNDAMSMRFWLEALNFSWGDYILFEKTPVAWIDELLNKFPFITEDWRAGVTRFMHRIPAGLVLWPAFGSLVLGWMKVQEDECQQARSVFSFGLILLGALFGLSFFTFLPYLDFIALSPIIRQFHQATKYTYVGAKPPRMLYVTDGGVRDCTALVQLMLRKQKRILLVLAASDPHDDLGVLKAAMQEARKQEIGTFFNPKDPTKDVQLLFDRFKNDTSLPYLHLGISYGWDLDKKEEGDLFIIKNRLFEGFENHELHKIQRPLTESQITGDRGMQNTYEKELVLDDEESWEGLTTDQLGPFGCCDCCHTRGLNCGPKFPHGTATGYLYLSPQWCNSLMRLGHTIAEGVVRVV